MSDVFSNVIRRAIIDLIYDIGGERNDDVITQELRGLGHRVPRDTVLTQMKWLGDKGLLRIEALGPYTVGRITSAGRDVATGDSVVEGVSRFKTGE